MPDGFAGIDFGGAKGASSARYGGKGGSGQAAARDSSNEQLFWWQGEGGRPEASYMDARPAAAGFPSRSGAGDAPSAKYPAGYAVPPPTDPNDSRQMQEYMQQYMMQLQYANYTQLFQNPTQSATPQIYQSSVDVAPDKAKPGDDNPYPHYAPAVIRDSAAGNVQLVQMPMPVQVPPGWMLVPVNATEEEEEKAKQLASRQYAGSQPLRPEEGKGEPKGKGKGKEPMSRNKGQAVAKIFVGGLGPHTTAESLRQHFSRFGTITDSSVVNKPGTNESRGFGFVEFENGIPTVVLEKQHIVDNRRCSVRAYNYSPA